MNVTLEEKKIEAIRRMKKLGIFPETINQFEKDGQVSVSEPPLGAFFWAEPEDMDRMRQFEAAYHALVYLVIRSYTQIGKMDSYLYVSDHPEEWEMDHQTIAAPGDGLCAYVYNHDDPYLSEIGYIGVAKTPAAGLRRIW